MLNLVFGRIGQCRLVGNGSIISINDRHPLELQALHPVHRPDPHTLGPRQVVVWQTDHTDPSTRKTSFDLVKRRLGTRRHTDRFGAEALIYPTRSGQLVEANDFLDDLGLTTEVLSNEVADCARELRAQYGNRHFPMLDAIVVAYGLLHTCPIITCDAKWPAIDDADILVLSASYPINGDGA